MKECCSNYENISISVEGVEKECEHGTKKGLKFQIKDLIPDNLCVHAYNIAYPYCHTLVKKGWFLWVEEGDGVIAQCPNPGCSLVMKIKPDKTNGENVEIKVIDIRGKCGSGHKVGDVFVLKPKEMKICPEFFPAVYPPATALYYDEKNTKPILVRTRTDAGEVSLGIKKKN